MSNATTATGPSRDSPEIFSARFRRAAIVERDRLARRLAKAQARVRKCKGELAAAEAEAAGVEGQIAALEQILGPDQGAEAGEEAGLASGVLRGREIREIAIEVLLARGLHSGPMHYRQWLALLEAAGYRVAGKRADAVFLNQVVRSPLVKASGRAGFYEVDLGAPTRLAERVAELQGTLTAAAPEEARDARQAGHRNTRFHELSLELGRVQRSLVEALSALPDARGLCGIRSARH